jgi:acyl carrier protein
MDRPNTDRATVRERIASLLTEIARIPREKIVDTATIDGDLRMESVDFVELQVALEQEYQIEIDPIVVVELNQFAAIVDYVHHRVLDGTNEPVH